ncbi:FlgB family protein [Falsihalocynthiibacter sp. S25ZX9]|jgi:flagellar basal-body rod protein FlgB|uniref:Flagellar basal body rod protein FlgB n=1 Tax=Falsihalocynthiibacter arcticus TaxID=1579316 RepID=A0A126UY58_9RHOB|nr:FlgB family protein [Falsihalocynthiibacter arcticus]AML51003.1 flagellar biosynthesis protein FlgB [Falsihalocynthiibacter arcticus]
MFDKLDIMRMSQAMASHASTRQATIAQNVANADTPGYKARDVVAFSDAYEGTNEKPLRASREGHLTEADRGFTPTIVTDTTRGALSPNGNSVSLETELMRASETRHQFDTAISIYKSSLNILRTSIR